MNAPALLFTVAGLGLAPIVGVFVLESRKEVRRQMEADAHAGELAEFVGNAIAGIQRDNVQLVALAAGCLLHGGSLSTEAIAFVEHQTALVELISARAAEASRDGLVVWRPRPRGVTGLCGVPPPLELRGDGELAFSFRGERAGVRVEIASVFAMPGWRYDHDGVWAWD